MAGTGIARSALVLSTNYSRLVQGLDKSYARIQSWKNSVQGLVKGGWASSFGGKLGSDVLQTAQQLAMVGQAAKSIGANTAGFMGLDAAIEKVTGHAGAAAEVLSKLSAKVGQATIGGDAARPLAQLGLDAAKLAEMSPDQQFIKIADALSRVENESQRAGLATKLFEEQGLKLLPVINQGGAALEAYIARQKQMGVALGEADIAKVQKLKETVSGVGGYFVGAWNKITVALAPILTAVGEKVKAIFERATPWIDVLIGGISQFADLASSAFEYVLSAIEDALKATGDWLGELYGTNDAAGQVRGVVETIGTRTLDIAAAADTVGQSFKSIWYTIQSYILKGLDAVKHTIADMIEGFASLLSHLGIDIGEDAKYWADGVRSAEFLAEAAEREQKAREASAKAVAAYDRIGSDENRQAVRNYLDRVKPKDEDLKNRSKVELPSNFMNVLGAALAKGSKEEYSARARLETGLNGTQQIPMKQLDEQKKTNQLLEKIAAKDTPTQPIEVSLI